ncbi:MAG TPA: SemiSWEET transporter [Rickettsiales bacterium]|nr:SemiSWEET transporter [Rickettsiales bacterium]
MIETIGLLAAILTTACYIPQALHVVRSRNTGGISLLAYTTLFIGIALWFIYGLFLHDLPLMLANGITLPLVGLIIVMKLRHK